MGRGAEGSAALSSVTPTSPTHAPSSAPSGGAATLLADPRFAPFLVDEFDAAKFASEALASGGGQTAQEAGADLAAGARDLGSQIRAEVASKSDDLLRHAGALKESEASLAGVRLSVEGLRSAATRLSDEVMEPFTAAKTRASQLANLQATAELLRHVSQRLKLAARLRQQLSSSSSLDLAKAAKLLADAKAVSTEADLSGIDALVADDEMLASAERKVLSEAELALAKGMSSLSQAEVGSALQVYHNLGQLRPAVQRLLSKYSLALSGSLSSALDAKKIAATARAAAASSAGSGSSAGHQLASATSAAQADELWARVHQFVDDLHGTAVAVWHLQRVLAKKRDPLSHELLANVVQAEGGPSPLERFWSNVSDMLRDRLAETASGRDLVRDGIGQGYPRLAALLEGALVRLARDTDVRGADKATTPEQAEALLAATAPFRDAYLSAASRRLADAVGIAFPGGAGRAVPSAAEVQRLVGRLHEELKAAASSEGLAAAVGIRVGEALGMLAERAGYMAATGPELRQLGSQATPSQVRNISLCSSLQEVHRAAAGLLTRLGNPAIVEAMRGPLEVVQGAAVDAVAPIFRASVDAAEQRIIAIHGEGFGQETEAYETATSPVLEDLGQLLTHFRTEFLSRFSPPPSASNPSFALALVERMACRLLIFFVRHASLLRPLAQAGRLRLAKDAAELEAAVGTNLVPVEQLGAPYRMLRAFRPLLFTETGSLDGSPLLKELPVAVVLHHLYSRAPLALQSPMDQGSLTPSQWSLWLDQHSGAEAVSRIATAVRASKAAAEPEDADGAIPLMLKLCNAALA